MFILIFYTHRENVKRLKNKEEKIRQKFINLTINLLGSLSKI